MRKFFLVIMLLLGAVVPVAAQDTGHKAADLADADGKFMTVNDMSIYYVDRGPADGTPVILLHGFLGSVPDWNSTIPALTDAGYRVIAFDRPPFGLSDKRTTFDYSTKAMSKLTAGVMDNLKIDKAIIVAHSLGGAVAAQFALDYPARVTKLVLVDGAIGIIGSKPQFDIRPERDGQQAKGSNRDQQGIDFLQHVNPDSVAAQMIVHGMFDPNSKRNILPFDDRNKQHVSAEELKLRDRLFEVKGWEGGLLAFARDAFTDDSEIDLDALKTVQVPVLLIWGQDDKVINIKIGETLRDLFPNHTWITYPDVGHTPMDENTTQFNSDLVAYLTGKS